ncbi:MAG: type II secretion system protein [Ectothiorhodospiraceae bacterium]|nr:type II secretion system protein [Ectothiorhodospiraceae bacterium]
MKKQAGFTLIELVVVIVILGLLAAIALPKFIGVTTDARIASLNGIAGGLRSAASLARAEYVVTGNNAASTITMDGQSVAVLVENTLAGRGGRPTQAVGGISIAMPDPGGYTVDHSGATSTYTPTNGGSTTCRATYDADSVGDPVVVVVGGC